MLNIKIQIFSLHWPLLLQHIQCLHSRMHVNGRDLVFIRHDINLTDDFTIRLLQK